MMTAPGSQYSIANDGSAQAGHVPVLPDQVIDLLKPQPGQTYLDATLGRGGHAALILPRLGPGGTCIGLDTDAGNAAFARQRLEPIAQQHDIRLIVKHANFVQAFQAIEDLEIPGAGAGAGVDLLLADLGFASNHVDDPTRGFTFKDDGPLDMRLNRDQSLTAAELVNTLPESELADLIFQLGEERLSRRIARSICETRKTQPIETTAELAESVRRAYPAAVRRNSRLDPATRTFMALRIAVNDELGALDAFLEALPRLLNPGGRAGIISFHSLEDRRVKRAMQELDKSSEYRRLNRKPIVAEPAESASNPRSRSAKLRGIERLA